MKKYQVQFCSPSEDNHDGWTVVTAMSKEHAIAIVESDNPDYIVFDAIPL